MTRDSLAWAVLTGLLEVAFIFGFVFALLVIGGSR